MAAFWRKFGRILSGARRNEGTEVHLAAQGGGLPGRRSRKAARAIHHALEALEDRRLLATAPLPSVISHLNVADPAAGMNLNTPSIAYDPVNPLKMVTAYTAHLGDGTTEVFGRYSIDGGASWQVLAIPAKRNGPGGGAFEWATDASVAFDRNEAVYLVYVERAADNSVGEMILQKFDFTGDAPIDLSAPAVRAFAGGSWSGGMAVETPMVAVDNNLPTFTDPMTGLTVTDPFAGNVYIAWTTGGAVQLIGSSDIAKATTATDPFFFSPPRIISDASGSCSSPRMVISQGTAPDPVTLVSRVTPGQLNVIWDNFSGNADTIYLDRITDGISGFGKAATGLPKPIADATEDPGNPDVPSTTTSAITVLAADVPAGFVATSFTLSLSLTNPFMEHLRITLTHAGRTITLVRNGRDGLDAPTGFGVTGADMSTRFDDAAAASIITGTAPFAGSFQPEKAPGDTAATLNAYLTGVLTGAWTLSITDMKMDPAGTPGNRELLGWSLSFTSGLTPGTDVAVATTRVRGAISSPFPTAQPVLPDRGFGPGATVASDNTLGSFSAYQGRLYVAYTGYTGTAAGDRTDIFLMSSDEGGDAGSWSMAPVRVNDDNGMLDSFSEGGINTRPHFQPEVAVDQTTGTVVVSYYDARHDAARSRVARYFGASIDGGGTFGPQIFANEPNIAIDAVTGKPVNLGPTPDNQGAGFVIPADPNDPNSQPISLRDPDFGFGDRQAMAVVNGRVNLVWSGNRNDASVGLGMLAAVATIPGGPRVISSTMGPVSQPNDVLNPAVGGLPTFAAIVVQFDRPVNPATFTDGLIHVMYRDTDTSGLDAGIVVHVLSPTATDAQKWGPALIDGATRFLITLATPWTAIGTYSYYIDPLVTDRVWSESIPWTAAATYAAAADQVNLAIPVVGEGGSGDPLQDITTSRITIPDMGPDHLVESVTVNVSLTHPLTSDLVLTLIAPNGRRVLLANMRGAGADYTTTVFDDAAAQSIGAGASPFIGSFQPEEPLAVLRGLPIQGDWLLEINDTATGNVGMIDAWSLDITAGLPATFVAVGDQTNMPIPTSGAGGSGDPLQDLTTSTMSISGVRSDRLIQNVKVNVDLTHMLDGDLVLTLIAPDGARVLLANHRGAGANYTTTVFDDAATTAIAAGASPFTGSYRPEEPLSGLIGLPVNGDWKLEINDTAALNTGVLLGWSLDFTTFVGNQMDQNSNGTSGEAAVAQWTIGDAYAVPNPTGQGSFQGAYFAPPFSVDTLPIIVSGPRVFNANARLPYHRHSNLFNLPIPASDTGGTGDPVKDITRSTISFPGSSGLISNLKVQLSLAHAMDSDLVITLVAPNNTTRIVLVDNRGGVGQNFVDTIFDDAAAVAIADGVAPFTGSFRPEQPLGVLNGMSLTGTWTLEIEDQNPGQTGTLLDWSIDAQTVTSNEILAVNATISYLDVTFDRDMDPTSITPASVLRMMGPTGVITGPFTITPDPLVADPDPLAARTYRIGFPTQELSGTYTLTLASTIRSKEGYALDENLNAGVDLLREVSSATVPVTFGSTGAVPIGHPVVAPSIATSIINIGEDFRFSRVTVKLNITYANDPDLEAVLISPVGTKISLFHNVGSGPAPQDFRETEFDDAAELPIENDAAPFYGRYRPRVRAIDGVTNTLSDLVGESPEGDWTLQITDTVSGRTGSLTSWSLSFEKILPPSGLGEDGADRYNIGFRIFTQDPVNPLSHSMWTSVGPGAGTGRMSAIAVDPSDPSGNTVYVGAASGGVWKTTNFLTNSPQGPTYIPLTDFGPVFAMRIGSIAIFPRNNDPNQSIIFAGTGEGDLNTTGVGFLRSTDGGATWTLLDSATNVAANGAELPINSPARLHQFVGSIAYKIVVDPRPATSGDVIVYAALSGNNGGIWRSLDNGDHWQLMRTGQATDVALDQNSGYYDTHGRPAGNLKVVYGAFRGDGVYRSPDRGERWNPMPGDRGVPQIRDADALPNPTAIPVNALGATPNGGKGRIVLAKPELTGDPVQDLLYQHWLYALVATPPAAGEAGSGSIDGLYITKDDGDTWTRISIPARGGNAVPTNNYSLASYEPTVSNLIPAGKANFDLCLAVDPSNPNIVYVGGTTRTGRAGLIRIDTTGLADPHAIYSAQDRPDGGLPGGRTTDAITLKNQGSHGYADEAAGVTAYLNVIQDPVNPFATSSTYLVSNVASLSNSGTGSRWKSYEDEMFPAAELGDPNYTGLPAEYFHFFHRLLTVKDAVTGLTRLIIADEQGIYTSVDDGTGERAVGIGTLPVVSGPRSGNLQVAQFYYGAAQPSNVAAMAMNAMFYGTTDHEGTLSAPFNVLNDGNVTWTPAAGAPNGGSTGVATNQVGDVPAYYQTRYPGDMFMASSFFLWKSIGRTSGLLQSTTGAAVTGDDQWPDVWAANFAVNPIDGNQIIVSSSVGRLFGTEDQGRFWSVLAEPGDLDGTYAPALAFGAPDPNGPGGPDATNFLLYAGTTGGRLFVTFTGGGGGGGLGNAWLNISGGLDGSPVKAIVTNPSRGSREAYAVTERGVYYMADSAAKDATNQPLPWVPITGNLPAVMHNSFGNPNLPEVLANGLTAIQIDWRYLIPDPTVGGLDHPVVFVAGEAGVFRSLDHGQSWKVFPDPAIDGAVAPGGYLPNVRVNDLDLTLGNIDPTSGRENAATGNNTLLATTWGRGSFAIRLSPVIIPNTLTMDNASDTGVSNIDRLTNDTQPIFTGISQQTAFGNTVRITLLDLTDPADPRVIGGYDGSPESALDSRHWTDAFGNFTVQVNPGMFASDGQKTIGVRATDDAGTVGGTELTLFTLDTQPPVGTGTTIAPTEGAPFTGVVASFTDTSPSCTAVIDWGDGSATTPGTIVPLGGDAYDVRGTHTYTEEGTYTVTIAVTDPAGNAPGAPITTTANVIDPSVVPSGAYSITVDEGTPVTGQTVAAFTNPGGPETLADYVVTINWGDGQTTPGTLAYNSVSKLFTVTGSHLYNDNGVYSAVTTVEHDASTPVTIITPVTVNNVAPTPLFFGPTIAYSDLPVTFTISATDPSPDDTAAGFTYSIDWADGSAAEIIPAAPGNGAPSTVQHTYDLPGIYSAQLTATDKDGGTGTTTNAALTILVHAPVPMLVVPAVVYSGMSAAFTRGATDPSPVDTAAGFAYAIYWGDGTPVQKIAASAGNGAASTVQHTYAVPGTYKAQVTATDAQGYVGASSPVYVQVRDNSSLQDATVNNGEVQRSKIHTISFRPTYLGKPVQRLKLANLWLLHNGNHYMSLKGAVLTYTGGVAYLDVRKLTLPDGDYQLQVKLGTDVVRAVDFFQLAGDANGDLVVNSADRGIVVRALNTWAGKDGYNPDADLNSDGIVDTKDRTIVRTSLGHTLKGTRRTVYLYTNRAPYIPAVNFRTVKANSFMGVVDLVLYNASSTGNIRIKDLGLASGAGVFGAALSGTMWKSPADEFVLGPKKRVTVRVYMTPGKPEAAADQLSFYYNVKGRKYYPAAVPLNATIVR